MKTIRRPPDLVDHFARGVLRRSDGALVDTMTRLAPVRRFNRALVDMLARPHHGDAALALLVDEHLCLLPETTHSAPGWFSFHPCLHDLLLQRFALLSASERARTHAALSQWFWQEQHAREAVHHAVAAGHLQQAVHWIEQRAYGLFLAGRLEELATCMQELPYHVAFARPSLLPWVGWAQFLRRDFQGCHQTLRTIRTRGAANDATRPDLPYSLLACSLAMYQDDFSAVQALVPEIQALHRHTVLDGGRRNVLGWMQTQMSRFDQAQWTLQELSPVTADSPALPDSDFGCHMSKALLGMAMMYAGESSRSETVLRAALAEALSTEKVESDAACNIAALLSVPMYESNDVKGVRDLIDHWWTRIEQSALPDALITAAVASARMVRAEKGSGHALQELSRLEELLHRRSLDRGIAAMLSERIRCAVQIEDEATISQALISLNALAERHQGLAEPSSLRIVGLARYSRALAYAHGHASRQALAELEAVDTDRERAMLRGDQSCAHALRALLLARLGQQAAAIDRMTLVLRDAQRTGKLRCLLDMGSEVVTLAVACIHAEAMRGRSDAALSAFVIKLQALHAPNEKAPWPCNEPQSPALSEREGEVLRALASSMSNKTIARGLGLSPETVKWHLRNVYAKLNVNDRDDAVCKARDLGLIAG